MTVISTLTSSSLNSCHSTDELISQGEPSPSPSGRWLALGLLFFGAFTTTLSRINFNATIAELSRSNDTGQNRNSTLFRYYKLSAASVNESVSEPEELQLQFRKWSESEEDTLNGAFLIGYSLALIPSCQLGVRLSSTKRVAAVGGLLRIIANLLTPTAYDAMLNSLLFLLRVAVGAACSTTVPAFFDLLQQAVPPGEKSKAIAALKIGSSLGGIFLHSLFLGALSVFGQAASAFSFKAIFYFCAGLDLVWLLLWMALVKEEGGGRQKAGLDLHLRQTCNLKSILGRLVSSSWTHLRALTLLLPMAVMVAAKLANVWLECLLTAKLPQYFTSVRRLDVAQTTLLNGVLSGISFLAILASGSLADWLAARMICTLTVLRKTFEAVASLGIVTGMLLLAIYGGDYNPQATSFSLSPALLLVTFSVVVAAFGLVTAGSSTIIIDMTAEGDASLIALLSTLTTVFGFATPHLMTAILSASDNTHFSAAHSSASWSAVFLTTALIYALSGLLFTVFASSEKQQWRQRVKEQRAALPVCQGNVNC